MDAQVQKLELVSNSTKMVEGLVDNISPLPQVSEQQVRRATDQVARLQSEVAHLRKLVEEARRSQAQQELLLRNTRLRELELRASLTRHSAEDEAFAGRASRKKAPPIASEPARSPATAPVMCAPEAA